MHIIFLTPGFAKDETDTTCFTYFQNYLIALKKSITNINIHVIAFQYPYQKNTFKWHEVNVSLLAGSNRKFPYVIKTWKEVIQLVKNIHQKNRVDIIHSLWLRECALVGNWINRVLKIPHLTTIMGTELIHPNRYLTLMNTNKLKLVSVSPFVSELAHQKYPQLNINTIPWGIADNEHPATDFDEDRPIDLLGVGFLSSLKNFVLFIKICHLLKKEFPKLKAVIIGEGSEQKKLENLIIKYQLEDIVELKGLLVNEEVKRYMQQSKILLHSSNFESQGYVFLEALSKGMSIVSRPVGIAQSSSRWYMAEDENTFSKHCTYLLKYQTDFSKQIPYPIDRTVADYYQLYNSFL